MSDNPSSQKKPRGFACLSKERLRELCSQGGKRAHAMGKAHTFNSEQGKAAGKKGGVASGISRRAKTQAFLDSLANRPDVIQAAQDVTCTTVPQQETSCPPTTSNAS